MLVLALERKREGTRHRTRAHPRNIIKALSEWTAEVVDDGLTEVITVPKRRTGNSGHPGVKRIHICTQVRGSIQAFSFSAKFFGESRVNFLTVPTFDAVVPRSFLSFIQQAGALHASPGAHAYHRALDVTQGN